jgi:non-ribosomal peptide synthase protein (TIGR01720 family)
VARKLGAQPYPEVFFNYFGPDVASELKTFEKIAAFNGYPLDRKTRRLCVITIGGFVQNDRLFLKWDYSENLHRRSTIEALTGHCQETLRAFLADYQVRKRKAS